MKYHHIGIPTQTPQPGETYLKGYGLWCTDHENNPFGIQWMRYEQGCPLPELVRTVPHVAFEVDDLHQALAGQQVFLLRNLRRGSGIGFFEERGFYPDFILWIVNGGQQHIVFIEPHGMLHAGPYQNDSKARLHEELPQLAEEIAARSRKKNVVLDCYIVSATPYEDLRKMYDDGTWDRERFTAKHILFLERNGECDYLQSMFTEQLAKRCA